MGALSNSRIGIIDLGTNSVRFDVHKIGPGRRTRLLHREKLMVRLGQNVFRSGKLDTGATRRSLQALRRFKRIADALETKRILAYGTSTLREAKDSGAFLRKIRRTTGIDVRIISGEDEAKLIAAGILAHERSIKGKYALVDIGGGSTEISICRGRKILHCESFPLGATRLQQLFLKDIPPRRGSAGRLSPMEALRRHIRSVLLPKLIAEEWPRVTRIIGSSGTIRAIARIAKKDTGSKVITRGYLQRLIARLSTLDAAGLLRVPGMEAKRIDMILAGAVLLEGCLEALGAAKVQPTVYALRDGILREEVRALPRAVLDSSVDLFPLYAKACRFGCHEASLKQLVRDASLLFDRLQHVHGLAPRWRTYLLVAVIFRDVGWAVSPVDHQLHSYYIVKHTELPVAEAWEREFVGQLCLRHEGGKLDLAALPFRGQRRKECLHAFERVLALLRVVDALDPVHQERVSAAAIRVRPSRIGLVLTNRSAAELAKLRIQQKKDLFEKVFSRELSVADR